MREIKLAAVQMACSPDRDDNVARAESLVRRAARAVAQIVLLPELFETPYFCKDKSPIYFDLARPLDGHPAVAHFARLASELAVVLPVSVFERANGRYFNTVVVVDADGSVLGHYRKTHIPDGPGYEEKFYFAPGDTGFRAWRTRPAILGVGICWDQWFPESARAMALLGAEVLLYPTAIGSEPLDPACDSRDHWQRVMQGHAGANIMPLVAANRIGVESGASCELTFYGSSFIAGPTGEILAQAGRDEETVISAVVDLDAAARLRETWGVLRDRRPDRYGKLVEPG